jgi:3-dehydroquinate dehydratase-1
MQLVASVANPAYVHEAEAEGADCIELRLDLFPSPFPAEGVEVIRNCRLPVILTVRSRYEGGAFTGGLREWQALMEPWFSYAAMVDVEQQFYPSAPLLRDLGISIIASYHTQQMPSESELSAIESRLRRYGIPKIVVRPGTPDDVITLCSFTLHARQPIITSIMGPEFRYARMILPLFGSAMVFSYAGKPTAEGQFSVREAKQLLSSLTRMVPSGSD